MPSPELKPCPFCGSRDLDVERSSTRCWQGSTYYTVEIRCHKCWARHHGRDTWSEDDAMRSAVEKWNRRAEAGKENDK